MREAREYWLGDEETTLAGTRLRVVSVNKVVKQDRPARRVVMLVVQLIMFTGN